jgi:Type II CAAX prenyl endopeptidase Rce1-like
LQVDESPSPTEPIGISPAREPEFALTQSVSTAERADLPPPPFNLRLFFGLLVASLVATLAMLPYSITLLKQMDVNLPPGFLPIVLAVSVVIEMLLSAAMIALGIWLGPRLDMGRLFEADAWRSDAPVWRRVWDRFGLPLSIGIALGAIMVASLSHLEIPGSKNKEITTPNAWEGLLGSIGAGIREEIWLRFGLLTFFAWLGVLLVRPWVSASKKLSPLVFWIANAAAALSFAAIHIPQAHALLGLTARLLVFVFVGNGIPGLVFGWLYWRRGLIAAMIAHFGLDLVLKVVAPLFSL